MKTSIGKRKDCKRHDYWSRIKFFSLVEGLKNGLTPTPAEIFSTRIFDTSLFIWRIFLPPLKKMKNLLLLTFTLYLSFFSFFVIFSSHFFFFFILHSKSTLHIFLTKSRTTHWCMASQRNHGKDITKTCILCWKQMFSLDQPTVHWSVVHVSVILIDASSRLWVHAWRLVSFTKGISMRLIFFYN